MKALKEIGVKPLKVQKARLNDGYFVYTLIKDWDGTVHPTFIGGTSEFGFGIAIHDLKKRKALMGEFLGSVK